ncbi:hypothetical protein Tco_1018050 [Tanacetum coccineum]|uniref:Reverse transcriptase domain-containing protein n=1 Tax=Tanacetum coccineum TaxID=301880 RepID=A0ABQ5FUM9_9ASTR
MKHVLWLIVRRATPTVGYEDVIVVPEITADYFELKHGLLTLVQNKQFFGHDKEDPHAHIRYFNKITYTMKFPNVPSTSAWDRFNDLLRACPHHGFSELHQLDTFYNALNSNDQDSLNSAVGGNFLDKMPRDCLRIIESKSKVRNSRNKPVVAKVSASSSTLELESQSNLSHSSIDSQNDFQLSIAFLIGETTRELQEVWNIARVARWRFGSNVTCLWEAVLCFSGMKKRVHGDDVAKTVFRMRNGHVEVYSYAFWVNQCTSGFHRVNEPGRVRVAREDDCGVTEGREDVHEVFQQRGSRAKRKLSRCGRNRMGNEPILALPEEVDDFVMLYRGVGRRSEANNEFDIDVRRSNLGWNDGLNLGEVPEIRLGDARNLSKPEFAGIL